ncbi:MAG TPA: hypothetical protein VNO43_09070 [Candidatus Eisenbacteria bacterium]|nr:hypothetical protein [Candidatus Eisenbacteria bacterium]
MSKRTLLQACTATIGALAFFRFADTALADHYRPRSASAREEIREHWAEIRKDRADLRENLAEFYRDRAALRRAVRRGAPRHVIARRRAEVREELRDVAEARRELHRDYRALDRELRGHGWHRYPRYGYRYGNWRPDTYSERDRYGWWPWDRWWK